MIIALAVNASYRGRGLFRTLNILPWVIPSFVTAFVWVWLLHPQFGPINAFLQLLHIIDEPIAWLSEGVTAMVSLIAVYTWKGLPWTFLVLLAGLQTIPEDWYEAAKVGRGVGLADVLAHHGAGAALRPRHRAGPAHHLDLQLL